MDARYETKVEPFGAWLARQTKRDGWVGDLAKGLKPHPRFTKDATPDDVRKLLSAIGGSGDDFEAVDDAESAWQSETGAADG